MLQMLLRADHQLGVFGPLLTARRRFQDRSVDMKTLPECKFRLLIV